MLLSPLCPLSLPHSLRVSLVPSYKLWWILCMPNASCCCCLFYINHRRSWVNQRICRLWFMAAWAWRHCTPHASLLALPHMPHLPHLTHVSLCHWGKPVHNMATLSEAVGHFWWACQQDNEICRSSLLIATPSAVAKQICKYGCSNATQSQPATHNQARHTAVGTGINSIVPRCCCCCSDCSCCCCTCWRNKPHCIAFIATAAATLVARCTLHVAWTKEVTAAVGGPACGKRQRAGCMQHAVYVVALLINNVHMSHVFRQSRRLFA